MCIGCAHACTDPEGGGGQGVRTPLKNHKNIKNIGFLSNTGLDPLKITKLPFNVRPTSARQRNAIKMAFRCWTDDGPLIVVIGSFLPSSTQKNKKQKQKKNVVKVGPPLAKLSGSAHDMPNSPVPAQISYQFANMINPETHVDG